MKDRFTRRMRLGAMGAAVIGGVAVSTRQGRGLRDAIERLLPQLPALPVFVLGWSMGGYGALLSASEHPGVVAGVIASSAALWERASESARGAFDSEDDFAAHDVWKRVDRLAQFPVRIDCGEDDPFRAMNRELLTQLPSAEGGIQPVAVLQRGPVKHALPPENKENKPLTGKAAFFDIDGTLISTNVVHAYGYYAMNEGSLPGILRRTLSTVAQIPLFSALNFVDRKIFNEYFYRQYEGLTQDRLLTLTEDLFEDVVKPAIFPKAKDLIDEARRAGCRIVLVTGALDFTMRPLARHLGADDMIANRMQFVGGIATGKIIPPIIEGANKANVIREYCEANGISLMKSFAYTDSASDYAMLTVVGRPTAVNPDIRLRALARSYNWPILDVR